MVNSGRIFSIMSKHKRFIGWFEITKPVQHPLFSGVPRYLQKQKVAHCNQYLYCQPEYQRYGHNYTEHTLQHHAKHLRTLALRQGYVHSG